MGSARRRLRLWRIAAISCLISSFLRALRILQRKTSRHCSGRKRHFMGPRTMRTSRVTIYLGYRNKRLTSRTGSLDAALLSLSAYAFSSVFGLWRITSQRLRSCRPEDSRRFADAGSIAAGLVGRKVDAFGVL